MTSKLDTAGLVERNHDPKLVEALKTIKARLEALPESLRGPFIVEGLAPYSLTQAAAPDMEPVAWRVNDYADGWILCHTKAQAEREAENGNLIEPLYSASQLSALQERVERAERERDEAFAANERDRSFVADARNSFNDALQRRSWLLEGRGSYEWDDDRWKDEFREAIKELGAPMEALGKIGIDWSLCPTSPEEIAAARFDWKARAEAAEARIAARDVTLSAILHDAETVMRDHDPGNLGMSGDEAMRRVFAFVRDAAPAIEAIADRARAALAHKGEGRP